MGNSGSSTHSFWPPTKIFKRKSKHNSSSKRSSKHNAPPVAPMYDTVADFPVYSIPDKSRKHQIKEDDSVQYAEVEVVRPSPKKSQKKPATLPKPETEYATLNFPGEHYSVRERPPVPQKRSVHQGNSTGQPRSPRNYNSANGTLV